MKNQLLFNKSFFFYLIGQTISSLGDGFYMIGFMWLALKLSGGKGIVLGGVFSIYALCEVVFGFIAGPVADRFNKKRMLIVVDIIRGLIVFILFLLVKFNTVTMFHLYIITFLFSISSPFFHRTEFTIIPQLVEKEMLLRANGVLSGSKRLMQVISPLLGGVSISIFGVVGCFLFDTLSFLISVFCIMPIAVKSIITTHNVSSNRSFFTNISDGYKILITSSFLTTLALYAACINFLGGPIFPLLPLISEKINFGASGYGLMMGIMSAGLIASSFLIGFIERYLKMITMLFFGLIISATAISLMGLSSLSLVIIIASFILGVGMNISNLPIVTIFQKNIPEDKIGVVSSFVFTIAQIAMPVSMVLSGFLVDVFSLTKVFVGIGVILLIGAIVGFALPQFRGEEVIVVTEKSVSESIR